MAQGGLVDGVRMGRESAAGVCPGLGVPGLCRHLAGQGGRQVGSASTPTLAGGCQTWLAWGLLCVPTTPYWTRLKQIRRWLDLLLLPTPDQTRPELMAVALGLRPRAQAATCLFLAFWGASDGFQQDVVARTGGLAVRPVAPRLWGPQGCKPWTLRDLLVGMGLPGCLR